MVCTHCFNLNLSEYSPKTRHYILFPILALILVHYSPFAIMGCRDETSEPSEDAPLTLDHKAITLFPVASLKTAGFDIPQLSQPLVVQVPTCLKHIAGLKFRISKIKIKLTHF